MSVSKIYVGKMPAAKCLRQNACSLMSVYKTLVGKMYVGQMAFTKYMLAKCLKVK
jgi:hypothetical protein